MAELHDQLIIVRVIDSYGHYVRNALVQLVIDDEPFTQAYDTNGPVTFQASDTGKHRIHVLCGTYDGWFDYSEGMAPIDVLIDEEKNRKLPITAPDNKVDALPAGNTVSIDPNSTQGIALKRRGVKSPISA